MYVYVCINVANAGIRLMLHDLLVGIDPSNNIKVTVLAPKIIEVNWDHVVSEEVVSRYYVIYNTSAAYAIGNNHDITIYDLKVWRRILYTI